MPLIYKSFQSAIASGKTDTNPGKKLFYPRLVKYKKVVDTQKVGELIAQKASLTAGDVHNVIRNLMEVMREQLLNSRTVKLEGLGSFTMVINAGGNGVESADKVSPTQIKYLKCQFTPEFSISQGGARTRALTTGVEYVHINQLAGMGIVVDDSTDTGDGNQGGGEDPTA